MENKRLGAGGGVMSQPAAFKRYHLKSRKLSAVCLVEMGM